MTPFGTLSAPRPEVARDAFRIAVFGDFSGRAARGLLEIGADLANRRAIKLDVDTIDDVIEGFETKLVLPIGEGGVEVELEELDDLEPDELFDEVEIFSELKGLRQQLGNAGTAAHAIKTIKAWGEAHGTKVHVPKRSAATSVPADKKLSAFQELMEGAVRAARNATPADELIAHIVGPYVQPGEDPEAAEMTKIVDAALSEAMRLVLHHPDFQAVEAQWRTVDLLARRIETDAELQIVLYDVSAEELAADLASGEALEETGLFRLLTEGADNPREAFSALFGLYTFEETPPHAHLLGRMARLAAHVDAPFFTAISPAFLEVKKEDRHPLVAEAWEALRALPEAAYLGVATPRFLLRRPYGARSEPIDAFDFEEFTSAEGLAGLLWANPVVAVAILLAQTWSRDGRSMSLGSVMSLDDMPYHYVSDRHGDQVALPCTERNLTTLKSEHVMTRGFMPLVSLKGQDVIRLASFQSVAGTEIRGRWSSEPAPRPSAPTPAASFTATIPVEPEVEEASADPAVEEAEEALDELDALLSEFEETEVPAPDADSDDIDAELAALLDDL